MNTLMLLEINYKYGSGFIKEDAENTIRTMIQNLSLKMIKYTEHKELVTEWKKERDYLYNILNGKVNLSLVK